MSNIQIDSVVSDPFGKTAKSIMNDILNNQDFKTENIAKHLRGSLKKKRNQRCASRYQHNQ